MDSKVLQELIDFAKSTNMMHCTVDEVVDEYIEDFFATNYFPY